MTIQTQQIIIDPASVVALSERRAARHGRPRKGVVVSDPVKRRAYGLTDQAASALAELASAMGVSDSVLIEGIAQAISRQYSLG